MSSEEPTLEQCLKFENLGYRNLVVIDGKLCGLQALMFTWGIVVGLDEDGYSHRYCYSEFMDASIALEAYKSLDDHPTGPWIKRKGSNGEIRNPNLEKELHG